MALCRAQAPADSNSALLCSHILVPPPGTYVPILQAQLKTKKKSFRYSTQQDSVMLSRACAHRPIPIPPPTCHPQEAFSKTHIRAWHPSDGSPSGFPDGFQDDTHRRKEAPPGLAPPLGSACPPGTAPNQAADATHRASSCLCASAHAVPSARKIPFPVIPTLPLVLANWAFWGEAQVSGPCDLPPWVPGPRSRRPPPDWAWHVPWCHNCLLIVPSRGR